MCCRMSINKIYLIVTISKSFGDMRHNEKMMRGGRNLSEEKEVAIDLCVMNDFLPNSSNEIGEGKFSCGEFEI
jgi:hypothetical protein